ncbi:MAG: glycoside hydrolase family 31 protein [Verrucomicrobiota bacterium]|nr:glycoside hydrolase family 31 protein [Verrucomicrobiota bacterium]
MELDIPHSAIYAEGASADSPALNQFMAARGIHVLSWFYPVIPLARQEALLPTIRPDELPILHCESADETRKLGYVDFTNPKAGELCRRWWKRRLDLGVAGSMVDFGDRVPEDAVFDNGRRGDEMHNFYSYAYDRTCSEVFREKRGADFILFARAAAPGTQKWAAQFAGDHPANFAGLQAVLTGALNLCACGFSTWGSDLGGFLGWPEPAVYRRWTQFACFSPLMRCHGRNPREPWHYGQAAVANYKYFAWVRENLLDYIYSAAAVAHETGVPIMRSMAVAFPRELSLADIKDQYLFGNDLLVAPVVAEDKARNIAFPRGEWTDLWDGKTTSGPANFEIAVPLDSIPVYLKQGAIVPVRLDPTLTWGASMAQGRVRALVVTPPKKDEEAPLPDHQGQSAFVRSQPTAAGFALTLKNLSAADYLLVYGAAVSTVKVDGKALPKLTGARFISMPTGWEADPAVNRFVVRLPASQARRREVEVETQPKAGTNE